MTNKAGVIGHPVKHSLSPIMHKAAYDHLGLNWDYEAIDLDPKNSRQSIRKLFENGYRALNVTMPFKTDAYNIAIPHGAASRLQSANTIISVEDELHCYSTDGEGFVASLRERNVPIENSFLVVGAGGAARAICDALVNSGAQVFITARKLDASTKLVEDILSSNINERSNSLRIDVVDYSNRDDAIKYCDVIVNATPVGMTINNKTDDSMPLNPENIEARHVVVDTIYHPLETKLLKSAKERSAKCINGIEMLIFQGALAFKLMTGLDAPIDIMRNAIENHIESTTHES